MEKSKKLRRYSRKDYTQLVDFPVEIVGRDGVVRRYSFDESIRLYQRRIASAPSRYTDREVVGAEVAHCRSRIEQLRKSFLHRYGWASIRHGANPGELTGEFAGEVAAFLRRFYSERADLDDLDVKWVQDLTHTQVFYVHMRETEERFILYLYRFSNHGACQGREAFFAFLRTLQEVQGQQVEDLVGFHHTADCGLVLTGVGDQERTRRDWRSRERAREDAGGQTQRPDPEQASDPYSAAMQLLAEGEAVGALDRLEEAVYIDGFRREAALSAASVADMLGQYDRAEMVARLGVHRQPMEPAFHHHLGLALLRRARCDVARTSLKEALRLDPGLHQTRTLLMFVALRQRRFRSAHRTLNELQRRAVEGEVSPRVRAVGWALKVRAAALTSGVALSAVAVALMMASAAGAALVGFVAVLTLLTCLAVQLLLLAQVSDRRLRGLRVPHPDARGPMNPRLDELIV